MDGLGEKLRLLREAHKKTQTDLAGALTGKRRRSFGQYVSKIERGEEDNPSLDKLEQIAAGFDMTLSAFVRHLENISESDLTRHADVITSDPSTEGMSPTVQGIPQAPKGDHHAGAREAHHVSAAVADTLRAFESRVISIEQQNARIAQRMAQFALQLAERREARDRARTSTKTRHAKSKKPKPR